MKKVKNYFIKLSSFFLIFGFLLNPISSVFAQAEKQNYFGIILNPAILFLEANPGETLTDVIRLTNDFQERDPAQPGFIGESTITYYPSSSLFQQSGEDGVPKFLFENTFPYNADASSWVNFSESAYTIDYGKTIESNFTVSVPEDAQPGGHYFALTFNENNLAGTDEVSLSKSIAALVFLTVKGDVQSDGSLVEFDTGKNWYEFAPVDFIIRYNNTGNVHEILGGNIFVHKGDITKPIATLTVNERGEKVSLPGNTRELTENWADGFITKNADGGYEFDWSKLTKIYIGKYKATLKLRHNSNGERITSDAEISFWMIPWKLIGLIILILALIILYFVTKRKRNKK